MALELLSTQCNTPGGMILGYNEHNLLTLWTKHLQHITFLQVNSLEPETIDFVAIIEVVRIPIGWKAVSSVDVLLSSNRSRYDPVFRAFQHHHNCPKPIGIYVERADCPFGAHYSPFQFRPQVRNVKLGFIVRRNTGLGDFVRCEAAQLTRNMEISVFCRQRESGEGRELFTGFRGRHAVEFTKCCVM